MLTALVGAQYGSEGKGAIAARIAHKYGVHIRTGGPNAGHTYFIDCPHRHTTELYGLHGDSDHVSHYHCNDCDTVFPVIGDTNEWHSRAKIVARSVPVGACNPHASLVIGPGGMIDIDELCHEVRMLDALGLNVARRLYVDAKAVVIDRVRHRDYEGGTRGHAHEKIGSTGEGVGIARMGQIARGVLARDLAWGTIDHAGDPAVKTFLQDNDINVVSDTGRVVTAWLDAGQDVLLEGTQGSGLSLVHGHWPYVTSTDTNAAQLIVDSGLSPSRLNNVILVARTYPIRVAGPSGPLFEETTWAEIGVEPEYTTVTRKERRVGQWDPQLFDRAIRLNGPNPVVALTFIDYIDPNTAGADSFVTLNKKTFEFIRQIEFEHNVRVLFVGTGPDSVADDSSCWWGKS